MSPRRNNECQLTIWVSAALRQALARYAESQGLPLASVARTCLEYGVSAVTALQPGQARPGPLTLQGCWEEVDRQVTILVRRRGSSPYRTAVLRRLLGLSVEQARAVDAWMERRLTHAPTLPAGRCAGEALTYFNFPSTHLPMLRRMVWRIKKRRWIRAKRAAAAERGRTTNA